MLVSASIFHVRDVHIIISGWSLNDSTFFVAAKLGTQDEHIIVTCPPVCQPLCLKVRLSPKVQVPLARLSQGLVLYFAGSIDRPRLFLRGDKPPLGASRPRGVSPPPRPAGEAERGEFDPLRFPLPLPLGTYTGILGFRIGRP